MPPCDKVPESYKGFEYDKIRKIRQEKLSPSMFLYYKKPLLLHQGYMQWVWDQKGQRYLDMYGGIVTTSVGHCHPKVVKAATAQLNRLWHTTNIYLNHNIHEYSEKLTSKLPGNLKVCLFCNSGSEANDAAMLMARLYTGAFDIISLRNSYHGASPYTMGLCGVGSWKYMIANGFGIHHAMNPDPYRGLWGGSRCRDSLVQTDRSCDCGHNQCEATDNYLVQLNEVLSHSLPAKRIAAFFAEGIQGIGGTVQFPKGYLKRAYKMIRERGGLCISDEVQTGFGRLGTHYWGFEAHGVVPDIVTMAKGIGNGFPLAVVVTTPEIAACLTEATYFNTFGGNPLACSVGSAVLDVIDQEKCQDNSLNVGGNLIQQLEKLRAEFEVVGDVRGKGLMLGIEMVKNKKTREPLGSGDVNEIFEDVRRMGVLIGKGGSYNNVFRIKPPMCITQADADFCVAVIRRALENYSVKRK